MAVKCENILKNDTKDFKSFSIELDLIFSASLKGTIVCLCLCIPLPQNTNIIVIMICNITKVHGAH